MQYAQFLQHYYLHHILYLLNIIIVLTLCIISYNIQQHYIYRYKHPIMY